MKPALLILDAQNGFIQAGSFQKEVDNIQKLATHFKDRSSPVILTRHIDSLSTSLIQDQTDEGELDPRLTPFATKIVEKGHPSAFLDTDLNSFLQSEGVTHLVITGFNVEYCCLFNSVIAHEKGYSVTYVEDASGTVNTDETYEMPGLDIRDFVATVLHWSGTTHVVDTEEYIS